MPSFDPEVVDLAGDSTDDDDDGRVLDLTQNTAACDSYSTPQDHPELSGKSVDRYAASLRNANSCGGFGSRGGSGAATAVARGEAQMFAQMEFVASMAKEKDGFSQALEATHSERLKSKIEDGKALDISKVEQNPPPLAPGQHTASRIGAAGPGDLVITIGDTDLSSVYSVSHTGKCFVSSEKVFKVAGVLEGWLEVGGEQCFNAIIAVSLGKVDTVRTNMNDMKKVKKITSMLHGKPVYNKTRFAGMARLCSGNMKRLQPYVTFEDGFSGAPDYEIETSYFGLLGGSWSPQEFKCLEYYDWDISPPRSASSSK